MLQCLTATNPWHNAKDALANGVDIIDGDPNIEDDDSDEEYDSAEEQYDQVSDYGLNQTIIAARPW